MTVFAEQCLDSSMGICSARVKKSQISGSVSFSVSEAC